MAFTAITWYVELELGDKPSKQLYRILLGKLFNLSERVFSLIRESFRLICSNYIIEDWDPVQLEDTQYCDANHSFAHSNTASLFVPGDTFNKVTVCILPAGIGNARYQIFQQQIRKNGGETESVLSPSVTHVVVDDNMDLYRALRLLKVDCMPSGVHLVKCTWLSLCISQKRLLDVDEHSLLPPSRWMD